MNVMIAGSRGFNNYQYLEDCLDMHLPSGITIIHGGAQGADSLANRYAIERSIPVRIYRPDWDGLGKVAGIIRNQQMIDIADEAYFFWDMKSPGTKSGIEMAKKKGIKHIVFDVNDSDEVPF